MSQLPYASVPDPPAQRPTSVTVVAVIGIILGALGLICTPLSIIPYVVTLPQAQGQANPLFDAVKSNSGLFAWTMASAAMTWVLAIILLSGSIGALGLREWARQFLIAWAFMSLLLAIAGMVVNWMYLAPRIREFAQAQGNAAAAAGAMGGMIGMAIGVLLGIGIPVATIFFMTRAHVKDAFARGLRKAI